MNSNNLSARSNLLRTFSLVSGLGLALTGLCTIASAQPAPGPQPGYGQMGPAPAPAAPLPPEKPWTGKPIPFAEVQPILSKYCYDCHGGGTQQKTKGGLALDTAANALKGGRSKKPAITPGHVNASEVLNRIALPATDNHHMPKGSPGKPPASLTADEIQKVSGWVASGADFGAPASAPPATPAAAAAPKTPAASY